MDKYERVFIAERRNNAAKNGGDSGSDLLGKMMETHVAGSSSPISDADVQANVREAFVAREYGVVKGGPAPYQNQDLYGDLNRMNDSILFNNYGPREMHPAAKAVSWNWTGPGKLDCNTISVNGCTSITLASTLMGVEHVTRIRDEMQAIIADFVAKNTA